MALRKSPVLWIILLSSTLTVMAGSLIGPVVNLVREGLDLSQSGAGLVITTHGIFVVLFSPLWGIIIDRAGTKRPFVAGLLIYGLSGGAGLFTNTIFALLLSRAALGIVAAAVYTSITVMILRIYGSEKSRVMGWRGSINSFSASLWPLIGGFLGTISWHLPFGVYMIGVPMGLVSYFTVPEIRVARQRRVEGDLPAWHTFRERPVLLVIYGLMFITYLFLYMNIIYLPGMLEKFGVTNSFHISLFLAVLGFSPGTMAIFYHRFRSALPYDRILLFAFSLWALAFIIGYLAPGKEILVLSVIIYGAGQGLTLPSGMLWVGDVVSSSVLGKFSSYIATFGFVGQFAAPVLLAPVAVALGLRGVFLAAAGIALFLLLTTAIYSLAR